MHCLRTKAKLLGEAPSPFLYCIYYHLLYETKMMCLDYHWEAYAKFWVEHADWNNLPLPLSPSLLPFPIPPAPPRSPHSLASSPHPFTSLSFWKKLFGHTTHCFRSKKLQRKAKKTNDDWLRSIDKAERRRLAKVLHKSDKPTELFRLSYGLSYITDPAFRFQYVGIIFRFKLHTSDTNNCIRHLCDKKRIQCLFCGWNTISKADHAHIRRPCGWAPG